MLPALGVLLSVVLAQPPLQDSIALKLQPLWTIGSAEDTAITFSRLAAPQIATDAKGLLYVVDADRFRVLVVDSDGRILRTLGRKGGGPGELELPFSLAVSPSGMVSVFDAAKRALIRFGSDGKPLTQIPLADQGLIQQVFARSDSTYIISANFRDSVRISEVVGGKATPLLSRPLPERKPANGQPCGLLGHAREPYFTPRVLWAATSVAIVTSTDGSFTLRSLAPAGGRDVARKASLQSTSAALARAYYGEGDKIFVGGNAKACLLPLDDVLRDVGMARTIPAYDRLQIWDQQVWALRLTPKGALRVVDVFDLTRGYVRSAVLGMGTPVAMLPGQRLVTLERDTDDVLYLQAYATSGMK